jgi:hypothetical protein
MSELIELLTRDPRHTCHHFPLCGYWSQPTWKRQQDSDVDDCGHDSCFELVMEQCLQCYAEDMENTNEPHREYCPDGCGYVLVTAVGGGPGMGNVGSVDWMSLECGHQIWDESL